MLSSLALLAACGTSPDAWDVSYKPAGDADVDTVKEALDELYVKCRARTDAGDDEREPIVDEDATLALRVQVLELKVQQLETMGLYDAEHITYDPTRTTLAGKTVQSAVTELEGRVAKVESSSTQPGEAGSGLYELRDWSGKSGKAPGGGLPAAGQQGGQQGRPPQGGGGQGGGQPGGGGMQGGGGL